jgi:hypothetical protein
MAVIKSGATSDQLTIDATSKAARVTIYNSSGTEIASFPATLGQKTMAGSQGVVLASDHSTIVTDDVSSSATGSGIPASAIYIGGSDGTNLRGLLMCSGANLTGVTSTGVMLQAPFATWSITHKPAVTTQATTNKGGGGGTVRHVCTGFSASFAMATTTNASVITVDVKDGSTVLWSAAVSQFAASAQQQIVVTSCCFIGTANTAMSISFSAAGTTGSQEIVNLWGYSVPA